MDPLWYVLVCCVIGVVIIILGGEYMKVLEMLLVEGVPHLVIYCNIY